MAVDTDFTSLFNSLKVEDPWLPPRPWESIPTESGRSVTSTSTSSPSNSRRLYDTSTVSEASLVRLAMNALQGLESSLTSIDRLCTIFRSDPTDRTFHRIPSLWNQSVSTLALEKILRSLGCMGCEVFFLYKFINHFTNLNSDEASSSHPPYSLVNQAFAVAIGDVLEGYIAALDTLSSSVSLRRSSSFNDSMSGCLSSVGHSEITLLEVFLHTKELRTQIEVIGSICNVHDIALSFSHSPLEDLDTQTKFSEFPRGGNLLTYLYNELKVADPAHCALLKTLFVRSCEPYFDFIRSWIFKAKIVDPFNEFIVAEADISHQSYSLSSTGVLVDFPSATIREEDGVSVPCFLREFLIPLVRAGQQLQVLIKLLEFSDGVGSWNRTYEEFLPYWSRTSSSYLSHASHMAFSKEGIEKMVLERRDYYKTMMEKLKNHLPNLEFRYHQVISHSTVPISVSNVRSSLEVPSANDINQNLSLDSMDHDPSTMSEDFSYSLNSSEYSSGKEELEESESNFESFHDPQDLENQYLSALQFKSDTSSSIPYKKPSQNNSQPSASHESDQNSSSVQEHQPLNPSRYDLSSKSLKSWESECVNNLIQGTSKLRETCSKVSLPSFDFKSIKDPFTQSVDRLDSISHKSNQFLPSVKSKNYKNAHGGDTLTVNKTPFHKHEHVGFKTDHQKQSLSSDVSGGGSWEVLLNGTGKKNNIPRPHDHSNTSVAAVIEIPLDFVIEKCLLEEIQLQYNYVSKLTIKLLEEGFHLQEHLLALRRYHMMESADWADLFIVSLWHHKWYASETDTRISEIQGLLELSVQRSSCERDHYKDRLFVYMKQQGPTTSVPGFATGIQYFNVLGLGYRVDWPVSIVLTPAALKIYAQIFSFLIQVKLASSSLTEIWCSFKEFVQLTKHDGHFDLRKSEVSHFNIMVKLRHQIFHFVSTLQQYVQSQLSHVSWCRFLQSLQHKVKDLTDLDIVHMDYLNDSQCICFLSNDMKQIADIIQSILQCALDFRSAAMPKPKTSRVNIAQVVSIKEAFEKNMRQLYACYLKSPKNVEFSLPRFWEYLNYNNHFSDVINKEIGHHVLSF
ncbi:hypothetical protein LXL04_003243 [Taraxacum kok-saghyz]